MKWTKYKHKVTGEIVEAKLSIKRFRDYAKLQKGTHKCYFVKYPKSKYFEELKKDRIKEEEFNENYDQYN